MFEVRLESVRDLSESTRDFRFARIDGLETKFQPGQFFRFTFEDEAGEYERSYSLCNFDDLSGRMLDLVISKVDDGRATKQLFNCELGLTAKVTGPYGRLVLPKTTPERLILVATSVGLAPYMPMLRALESAGYPEVHLIFGVRNRSEFIYGQQLLIYGQQHDFFHLHLCLSRETASAEHEFDGYVTDQLLGLKPDVSSDHIMLCGNPGMIDDAWSQLKTLGFKPRQVIREKYVFAREKKASAKSLTEEERKLIAEKMEQHR